MTIPSVAGPRRTAFRGMMLGGAFLAVACGNTPTLHTEGGVAEAQMAVVTAPMEAGITDLLDRWTAAWAAMDAPAFAAVYAVDADFVNPLGLVTQGRAAIQTVHTFLFNTLFKDSQQTWEIRRLVALTGNLALVDLNVELAGFQGTPPGLLVSPDGVVRSRARLLVARSAGRWEIQAQQLTAYVP
jgi:uncharacterized protein (TIGR02246 family)